jgi:hypothetical protein
MHIREGRMMMVMMMVVVMVMVLMVMLMVMLVVVVVMMMLMVMLVVVIMLVMMMLMHLFGLFFAVYEYGHVGPRYTCPGDRLGFHADAFYPGRSYLLQILTPVRLIQQFIQSRTQHISGCAHTTLQIQYLIFVHLLPLIHSGEVI